MNNPTVMAKKEVGWSCIFGFAESKIQSNQPMSKIQHVSQEEKSSAKAKYEVKNWSSYNQALVNRGSITLYFEESFLDEWYDDGPAQKGGQFVYSDLCIETLLMLKTVFRLPYRQTQGFALSLQQVCSTDLLIIDRIVHHAFLIRITGDSYRVKDLAIWKDRI